jgi:prophage DNA circulation protein
MTDNLTQNLGQATFKGVPFSVHMESVPEAGRKKVLHEYPNRDTRFIEDLGLLPKKFTLDAYVHGQDWIDKADNLRKVLEEATAGRLELPVLGGINNIFALTYSENSKMTEVGIINFTLEFAIGTDSTGPFRAPATIQDVYESGDLSRQATGVSFQKLWLLASDAASLLSGGFDLERMIRGSLSILANQVSNEQLSDVLKISSRIQLNAPSLIRSSSLLAGSLFSISTEAAGFFQQLSVSMPDDGSGFESAISLVTTLGTGNFFDNNLIKGDDIINDLISNPLSVIPLWPQTTEQRKIRNKNRLTLVQSNRLSALVIAFEQAAARTYKTKDEIQEVRTQLEAAYDQLMQNDIQDRESIQNDPNLRAAIESLRAVTFEILKTKEQEAYALVDLERVYKKDAFSLAYDLYAEEFKTGQQILDRSIDIRNLNPEQSAVNLNKDVTVFKV